MAENLSPESVSNEGENTKTGVTEKKTKGVSKNTTKQSKPQKEAAPQKQKKKSEAKKSAAPVVKKAKVKNGAKGKVQAKTTPVDGNDGPQVENKEKGATQEGVTENLLSQAPKAPPAQNSLLATANPDMILNMAIAYRDQINASGQNVDKPTLYDQVHNPETGLLKKLQEVRPGAGVKTADFDKVVTQITTKVEALLGGYKPEPGTTYVAPAVTITHQPTPPASAAQPTHIVHVPYDPTKQAPSAQPAPKPLTPKEMLEQKFGKILAVLNKDKETRIVHSHHVKDFCKLNSGNHFKFEYNHETMVLSGEYFNEKCEEVFSLKKSS